MMKLRAIKCKNMGAILVHERKPDGAHTDLVAEVHSGIKDAEHIAACVNAVSSGNSDGFKPLEFQVQGFLEQKKAVTWPEDFAANLDPTAIQGGVVAAAFKNAREQFGVTPDAVWVKPIMQDHVADTIELISAIETLIDGADLQSPDGFTPDNADGTLCGRNVNVFDLIRCAQILERVKGGAELPSDGEAIVLIAVRLRSFKRKGPRGAK